MARNNQFINGVRGGHEAGLERLRRLDEQRAQGGVNSQFGATFSNPRPLTNTSVRPIASSRRIVSQALSNQVRDPRVQLDSNSLAADYDRRIGAIDENQIATDVRDAYTPGLRSLQGTIREGNQVAEDIYGRGQDSVQQQRDYYNQLYGSQRAETERDYSLASEREKAIYEDLRGQADISRQDVTRAFNTASERAAAQERQRTEALQLQLPEATRVAQSQSAKKGLGATTQAIGALGKVGEEFARQIGAISQEGQIMQNDITQQIALVEKDYNEKLMSYGRDQMNNLAALYNQYLSTKEQIMNNESLSAAQVDEYMRALDNDYATRKQDIQLKLEQAEYDTENAIRAELTTRIGQAQNMAQIGTGFMQSDIQNQFTERNTRISEQQNQMYLRAQEALLTGIDPATGQPTTAEEQRQFENIIAEADRTGMLNGQQTMVGRTTQLQNEYQELTNELESLYGRDDREAALQSQQIQNRISEIEEEASRFGLSLDKTYGAEDRRLAQAERQAAIDEALAGGDEGYLADVYNEDPNGFTGLTRTDQAAILNEMKKKGYDTRLLRKAGGDPIGLYNGNPDASRDEQIINTANNLMEGIDINEMFANTIDPNTNKPYPKYAADLRASLEDMQLGWDAAMADPSTKDKERTLMSESYDQYWAAQDLLDFIDENGIDTSWTGTKFNDFMMKFKEDPKWRGFSTRLNTLANSQIHEFAGAVLAPQELQRILKQVTTGEEPIGNVIANLETQMDMVRKQFNTTAKVKSDYMPARYDSDFIEGLDETYGGTTRSNLFGGGQSRGYGASGNWRDQKKNDSVGAKAVLATIKASNGLKEIASAIMQHEGYDPKANGGKGTLAYRNNNPGNLRFIGQSGGEQGEGGFARFRTLEDGFVALINDIKAKATGKTRTGLGPNSTIYDLFKVYAPASDNNNPKVYAETVAKKLGVSPNAKIGTLIA